MDSQQDRARFLPRGRQPILFRLKTNKQTKRMCATLPNWLLL